MKKDEKKLSLSKRSTTPFDQKKFGSWRYLDVYHYFFWK
jgi:hypothetical protein